MYMVCFLLLEDDSVQLEALVMTKVLVEKQVRSKDLFQKYSSLSLFEEGIRFLWRYTDGKQASGQRVIVCDPVQ